MPGARREGQSASWLSTAVWFGAIGALPDVDLLFGAHSTYTHSIGAATLLGVLAGGLAHRNRVRMGLAVAVAYATHIVLDWLGQDSRAPIGIMALWPFTDRFYESDLHWFGAISRHYWLPGFWAHNLKAIAWEMVALGPITIAAWWIRKNRTRVLR